MGSRRGIFVSVKKWLITAIMILATCVVGTANSVEPAKKITCKEHPMLSGQCYKVRGRMNLANGTPSVRIWLVGTKRILGISEGRFYLEEYKNIPEELIQQLTWDNAIFADFTVCPFTHDKPGVMRLVCVASAENVDIRRVTRR
jgi:hypothetical protein